MAVIVSEEERQCLWALGRTDVDALSREADRLIAQIPRPGRRGKVPRRESDAEIAYLHDDVRSGVWGRTLGKEFQHDPFRLAARLNLAVHHVPAADLQERDRPSVFIAGTLYRYPNVTPFCALADNLNGHMDHLVMAHECGHLLGLRAEEHAWQFARAFMTIDDSDTPRGKWRRMEQDTLRRAREDSVRQARALSAGASHY